jgi:probable addiction module antidote protein
MTQKAKTKSFREYLIKSLADPAQAAEYINAALIENDVDFLLTALRDVAEAQGGMSHLARMTKLNRANLYQALSSHGDPRVHTLEAVLKVYGLRLGVLPDTMQTAA